MSDLEYFVSGKPVAAVAPLDLRRVFRFVTIIVHDQKKEAGEPITLSCDTSIIARECTSGSDAAATFIRAIMLQTQRDALAEWRIETEFQDVVFETMAHFPMPGGVQSFNQTAFIAELRRQTS